MKITAYPSFKLIIQPKLKKSESHHTHIIPRIMTCLLWNVQDALFYTTNVDDLYTYIQQKRTKKQHKNAIKVHTFDDFGNNFVHLAV